MSNRHKPDSKRQIINLILMISGSLIIFVGAHLYSRHLDNRFISTPTPRNLVGPNDSKNSQISVYQKKKLEHRPNAVDAILLSDSVLSIIQGYYVDKDRVDSTNLIYTMLKVLTKSPRVKGKIIPADEASDDYDEKKIWDFDSLSVQIPPPPNNQRKQYQLLIDIDGHHKIIPMTLPSTYQGLVDTYTEVGRLLDEYSVTLASNDNSDRNTSATIALLGNTLNELDAHSSLLSPDAYRELRQGTEGSFGGLGVLVGIRDHLLTVIKPLPHSPAYRAGIKKSDRILGIDELFTYGFTLEQLVEYMRGDPGTEVNLSLLRQDDLAPKTVRLRREIIQVDSVNVAEIVTPDVKILHLTIENFATRTSREVLTAIKEFRDKHHGVIDGLVLDLRSNPGGLLDQAVQVADLFLPSGVIVSTKGRREEVEMAGSGIDELSFPIVTLIDGDSASASEIVAGALQDHGRSLIVGQPSFGKGSVQTIFELPGDRAIKITIARYYTPSGRSIQNIGIMPDIWLQPAFNTKSNENIFGQLRYKNERFLHNHLETFNASTPPSMLIPARKAYYLSTNLEGVDELASERKQDIELDLAKIVLKKISKTYQQNLSDMALRSSHWLGLVGPEITQFCDNLDNKTANWLSQHQQVKWNKTSIVGDSPNISIELDQKEIPVNIGETFFINWKIHNNNSKPIDRISIFVASEHSGFETKEVLIGHLEGNETKKGQLRIILPNTWEEGLLQLRVGVAYDAWPLANAVMDEYINVKSKDLASIVATTELFEEQGGIFRDVLEGHERAKIKVHLENASKTNSHELSVGVINLSGKQSILYTAPQTIKNLLSGESLDLYYDIEGASIINSSQLHFGLYLDGKSLREPICQHFIVKSLPNPELSAKTPTLLGH